MQNRNNTFFWNEHSKTGIVKTSEEFGDRFDIDSATIRNTPECITAMMEYFRQAHEKTGKEFYGYFGGNTYVAEKFGEDDWSVWCADYHCEYTENFAEEHGMNGCSIRGKMEECIRSAFFGE